MASPVCILRPKLYQRLFGIVLIAVATFGAYVSITSGDITGKVIVLCVVLGVGGIPLLYLLWVGGYVLDDRGIKRKLVPGLPSPSTPYRLLWHEPIRASIIDYGFVIGKVLNLRNVGRAGQVTFTNTYTGFDRLLEAVREHAASFDERSLGVAEEYLNGTVAEAAQPGVAH